MQAGFRCDFIADSKKSYKIKITASTLYRLYVNGKFAGYGPARAGYGYIRVDELEINVSDGINKIAVEVAGYNCSSFYSLPIKSFLCAEILENNDVIKYTGNDFKGLSLDNLRNICVNRYSFQRTYSEVWNFDNSKNLTHWQTADELDYDAISMFELIEKFIPRQLPVPKYDIISAINVDENGRMVHKDFKDIPFYVTDISVDRIEGYLLSEIKELPMAELYGDFIPDNTVKQLKNVEINADEYVIFEMPCNKTGFLMSTITALEDSSVYLFFAEHNFGNGMIYGNIKNRSNIVKFNLKKSDKPYNLESFEAYTCKYIGIAVKKGKIVANSSEIREYCYPVYDKATFVSNNNDLNLIFDAAIETFKQNTLDVYMDCPGRERGGWLCDSFFTSQSGALFAGKDNLEKVFLDNYVMAQEFPGLPAGMIPHNYPCNIISINGGYIPQWAMWYVIELEDFVRTRQSVDVEEYRTICYGILGWLEKYENSDGLLEKMPGWNFVEWSKANEWVQDLNYPTNMLYSKMLSALGFMFDDKKLTEKAIKVKRKVVEQSFNGEYFIDNAIREGDGTLRITSNRSETCQYYAYFTGMVDDDDKSFKSLTSTVLNVFGPRRKETGELPEIEPSNAFIGNYLRLIILLKNKQFEKAVSDVLGYFSKMAKITGTLWEDDNLEHGGDGGSLNHGFASFAGVALVFAVAGISSINYKEKIIQIDHEYTSGINYSFTLDTDDGIIDIRETDNVKYVKLPERWIG